MKIEVTKIHGFNKAFIGMKAYSLQTSLGTSDWMMKTVTQIPMSTQVTIGHLSCASENIVIFLKGLRRLAMQYEPP
jgi:hypothetical protein